MIKESYSGYKIESLAKKTKDNRWSVVVRISRERHGIHESETYYAEDKISYVLKVEADKESINLGKNIINRNLTGF